MDAKILLQQYRKATGSKSTTSSGAPKVTGNAGTILNSYRKAITSPKKTTTVKKTSEPIIKKPAAPTKLETPLGSFPAQTILKPAKKQNVWEKISTKIADFFDSPESQKARAMNAMAIKNTPIGKNLDLVALEEKGGNPLKNTLSEEISKELGIRTMPTTADLTTGVFTAAVAFGLATATIPTLIGIGAFSAINELKSGLISAITKKKYKPGQPRSLSEIAPNAPADVKNLLDVADFLMTAKITHNVFKASPKAFEMLTKDIITKYNLPETVKLDAKTVADIYKGLNTGEQKDLVAKLGLSKAEIVKAVREGITIDIPSEKIVTVADKPYWAKLKKVFGKSPSVPSTVTYTNGKLEVKGNIAGLLPEGTAEPQELIGTVIKNGQEKTINGKTIIKAALDAQKRGQSVIIDKVEPKVKKVLSKTTIPQIEKAKNYTSASDFANEIYGAKPENKIGLIDPNKIAIRDKVGIGTREYEKLKADIQKNGMVDPIRVTVEKNGNILTTDGSQRTAIAKELGIKVPAIVNEGKIKGMKTISEIYEQNKKTTQIKPKIVSVPREQLPVGTGEKKVSRLEARTKLADRIQKHLDKTSQEIIDQLGLATYKQMNKKENIMKASEYVNQNPEEALEVLKGNREAPKGILRNSIFVAMQNESVGNVELARKLASIESTRLGQEIGILTEIDPDSPVKIMRDIIKLREKAFKTRFKSKSVREVVKKDVANIKEKVKAPDKYDWSKFLDSIEC